MPISVSVRSMVFNYNRSCNLFKLTEEKRIKIVQTLLESTEIRLCFNFFNFVHAIKKSFKLGNRFLNRDRIVS